MSAHKSLITEFIHYLQYERYFSPHTAKCYTADLQQFCGYLCQQDEKLAAAASRPAGANGQSHSSLPVVDFESPLLSEKLKQMDTEQVRLFLSFLREKNYSKSTSARKLATLRSFYKFLTRRGHVNSNPVASIRTPKQDKRLPKYLDG